MKHQITVHGKKIKIVIKIAIAKIELLLGSEKQLNFEDFIFKQFHSKTDK